MALISNIKLPDGSKHGIRALGIPYAEVDSTSTSTVYTATIPGITELVDGTCILLKNGVVTSAANFTININGLGAKPSYNNMATGNDITPTAPTRDTTIFNINYTMLFVYSSTLVDGGAWICYRGYDANTNTLGYQLRTNSYVLNAADGFRYYVILFTSADGTKWVPANSNKSNSATTAKTVNQTPINPFGEIVYCGNSTNYSAGNAVTATAIWQEYTVTLGYSFNKTGAALTLTIKKPVYVKCAPQADGSAIIDSTTPYVQDLPTTDDGKIYILLGIAYSATSIELLMNHPIYYYKDGAIRVWTNAPDTSNGTVTSVGLSMPTGFSVSNSPITSSGTLSVSMASGYTIPTSSQVNCWNCKISENSLKLSGNYTSNSIFSGNSTPVANNDTFETAIAKLDKIVQDNELVSAAAFANLNVRLNCHSTKISSIEGTANNAYSIANYAMDHACNLGSQLSYYAQITSPNFIGTPTAPTPINSSNDTLIATTAFVNTAILCNLSALCDFATKNYICSYLIPRIDQAFEDIDERFDNNSLVVSAALNDLNDKVTILSDEISNIDTSELQDLIDQLDAVVGAGLNDLNDNKQDKLNWDTTPTANSYNPVYSGGIKTELNKKQATLVSGTNIKTVNGCSLLGSGNITIQGGGGTVTSVGLSMPTGFTVSSTPITTNGTISVTMTSGYAIPTTTQVTCWNNKVSNVLSDWNATSGSAVILNKPTVISSIGYNSPGGYLTANSSNAVQLTVCSSNGRKLNIGGSTWQFTSTTEPSASADKSLIAPTWSAMTSAVSGKANAVSATAGTYRSVTVNSQGLVTAGTNPTTLSGYGITDAKIASGTITLGSNTITPLTSHQTLKTINSTAITGSGNISIPVVANLNGPNSLPSGASGTGVTISSTNYYLVSDKPYCTSSDVNVAPSWSAIQSCLSAVRTEMASSGGVTIYSGSSTPSSSLGSNGDIYIQTT